MGGNIDGSSLLVSGSGRLGGVARCWVLKGQPRDGVALRFRVQSRPYTARVVKVRGLVVAVMGSEVRWGVCELDSGCEHLVVQDCSLCVSV